MKKLRFLLLFLAGLGFTIVSCSDDDDEPGGNPSSPTITAPAPTDVAAGGTVSLSFSATVPGGFNSSSVTATGGSATVTSDLTAGATSGTIGVDFTADNTAGAGSVTLLVTDGNAQGSAATAVLNITAEESTVTVTDNIASDVTWTADKEYILAGRITVLDGATLTIEPGTLIKGEAGTGANATALLVARGGKLMAEGTAAAPIIFTSVADNITSAQIAGGDFISPNLDESINGLWGGVLVLGYAEISASADEVQIEGIPTTDTNGLYGGDNDADDSGIISYVSIRHGGTNIGAGNEINGLTLGAVGSTTSISNVEIVANQDDGIEWFGGSANITNALVWNVGDDAIDTDQAWNGVLDDFIVVNPVGSCFELDGPEGDDDAYFMSDRDPLNHNLKNGTIYVGNSPSAADFDDDTNVDMEAVYFFGFDDDENSQEVQGFAGMANGTMTNIEVTAGAGFTAAEIFVDVPGANYTEVAEGSNSVGSTADYSWTWASQSGALAGIGL